MAETSNLKKTNLSQQSSSNPALNNLLKKSKIYLDDKQIELIKDAYTFSNASHYGQLRKSGEPYINHPLSVASILADMKMDSASIIAAILHDVVEDTKTGKDDIEKRFGDEIARLVDGLTKIDNIKFLSLTDLICAAAPIGIFLGRISNFLNGELWGKESSLPWAIIFKCAGTNPRHPSQLYESFLEGIIIFAILYYCIFKLDFLNKVGKISGMFCILYSCSRIIIECFREPDRHIGFIYSYYTMGMVLSIPMLLLGIYLYLKNNNY